MTQKKYKSVMIRLDDDDHARLAAAASEAGLTTHQLGRLAIINYINGYRGPYVLRVPLQAFEGLDVA